MFNYQFTEAVEALYEYKIYGIDREILASTERLIDMAYNAREYINQPKPVRFELLDTAVNSIMNDFRPLVTSDGKKLFLQVIEDMLTNWQRMLTIYTCQNQVAIVGVRQECWKLVLSIMKSCRNCSQW